MENKCGEQVWLLIVDGSFVEVRNFKANYAVPLLRSSTFSVPN